MKTCDNCFWRLRYGKYTFCYFHKDKQDTVCKEHKHYCDSCKIEKAKFEQYGLHYCTDCLLEANEVQVFEVKHYILDGECIGDEYNMDEVIDAVIDNCVDINIIEE